MTTDNKDNRFSEKFPNIVKMQQEDGLLPPFGSSTKCPSAYERRRQRFNGEEDPEIERKYENLMSCFRK